MEAKFRNELIAYINTLNVTYENADIPACQASSLISPGGFKFAKFMLKISQLVIYEHLKKSNYAMLHCIKPPRNMSAGTSTQKCNLEKEVKLIERETKELLDNFNNNYANTNEKAKEIQRKLEQLNKEIQNSQRHLEEMQLEFNTKYPSYASLSSLEEQLVGLKQQIEKALELGNFVSSSEKLLKYLSSSMVLLGHDKNSPVFDDFAHIITNKKELDLCQFFQDLAVLVEKTAPQLQSPMVSFMQQTKEKIEHFYTKDQIILQHFKSEHERITNILDNLRDCFNGVAKGVM